MLRSVHGPLRLRIDPAEAPGILNIKGIRVRRHKSSKPLIALDETTGWEAVRMGNNLLRLGDSPALNLLSLNGDPHFFLPVLAIGDSPCDLVCEVWLRFSPDLTTLPDLLRPLSSALVARTQAEAGLAEARRELHIREQNLASIETKSAAEAAGRIQAEAGLAEARQELAALTDKQVRAEEQLRQANATIQALQSAAAQAAAQKAALESELAKVRRELHSREQNLATLEAKAAAESAGRVQAEAGLAEARQELAALTDKQVRAEEQLRQANATIQALQSAAAQAAAQKAALESELAKVRRELHSREQNL